MLIALILGYLFLGGSHGAPWFFGGQSAHQMSKEVGRIEPDKERRKEVERTLKQIEDEYRKVGATRSKLGKETLKALEQHDASDEQFRAIIQNAEALNTSANKALLDLRFTLRGQLTDSQWRALFPAHN